MTTPKREYIIGLINYDDLDNFYNDMESAGTGTHDTLPDREVECANRREISRNTHYWLTDEEAEQVRKDPRVQIVSLTAEELGVIIQPAYEQTSTNWNKQAPFSDNSYRNWGKLRVTIDKQIPYWGGLNVYENIASAYNDNPKQSATVNIPSSGKHVDVVVVDGHILPDHPEFAVNPDGTGGSRVKQINWFGLGVNSTTPSTYVYAKGLYGNDHGTHVAGIIAGNSQGWARDANIYNISPYGRVGIPSNTLFDYVRAFHGQKPINPVTGRKNPTIVNNSWVASQGAAVSFITDIVYRGVKTSNSFGSPPSQTAIKNVGISNTGQDALNIPSTVGSDSDILDIQDAMAEGIIFTAAGGNDSRKLDRYGDQDYDNYFLTFGTTKYYYNRGPFPGVTPGMITVGALGSLSQEYKAPFSACGPRIDIYAPGVNIMSSVEVSDGNSGHYDFRNDQYFISLYSGTSMATPQVTGVLACVLELYPNMKQYDALEYINRYALRYQMADGGNSDDTMGSYDVHDLAAYDNNKLLKYNKERNSTGAVYPKLNVTSRRSSGIIPYTYENGWRQEFNRPPYQLELAIWIGTKLYGSNDLFNTSSGDRYGLFKQPDAAGLNYWVSDTLTRYGYYMYYSDTIRQSIINNFFVAVAATSEASRALTNQKTFLYGPSNTRGSVFSDRPDKKTGQVYPRPRIYSFGVQRNILNISYDIPYGTNFLQKVDLLVPNNTPPKGVIVYIHGGAWSGGSKSSSGFVLGQAAYTDNIESDIKEVATAGYVVINCNYRITSKAQYGYGGDGTGGNPNSEIDIKTILNYCTVQGAGASISPYWTTIYNYVQSLGMLVIGNSSGGHVGLLAVGNYGVSSGLWPKAVGVLWNPLDLLVSQDNPLDALIVSLVNSYSSPSTEWNSTTGVMVSSPLTNIALAKQSSPRYLYGTSSSPGPWYTALNASSCILHFVYNTNDTLVKLSMAEPFINSLPTNKFTYKKITEGVAVPGVYDHNIAYPLSTYILDVANRTFVTP